MLKLGNKGKSWDELLKDIKVREGNINVSKIPNAMQPEALCGLHAEGNLSSWSVPVPAGRLSFSCRRPADRQADRKYRKQIRCIPFIFPPAGFPGKARQTAE